MFEAKIFRTFVRVYSLFTSERLSANIKFTLYKALIRSLMIYACAAWEFEADARLMKLQCLQKKVLHTTGNFPRHASVRNMHLAFKNYAGRKQKSYKIIKKEVFAILDKTKPHAENIKSDQP
jgi:hypothetical protein